MPPPAVLEVVACKAETIVWEIEAEDALPDSVTYGNTPAHTERLRGTRSLVDGQVYGVTVYARDRRRTFTSPIAWQLTFVQGDPDSVVYDWACTTLEDTE